jgi:hypothetical protein
MNLLLNDIFGVGLLAGAALVVAGGGVLTLLGLGGLERSVVPVRVEAAPGPLHSRRAG